MDPVSSSSATSHIPYAPPLSAYYGEPTPAFADAWNYATQQPEESYAQSSLATQTMYTPNTASPHSVASPSNTPSPQGQDSRMSMGEAQNVNNNPDAEISHRGASPFQHSIVRKKTIDRNRRPCANCSSSKRKCKIISTSPHLCERCKNHGLQECPPHISWTRRKQSVSGSLSPREGDDRSSRSVSPPYLSSNGSPVPDQINLAAGNLEYDTEAPFVCARSPQIQCWSPPTTTELHPDTNLYETHVLPPSVVVSQYPQGPFISIYDLKNLVCHVCSTPYDLSALPMNCEMNAASMSSPEATMTLHTSYAQMPSSVNTSTTSTYRSHTW